MLWLSNLVISYVGWMGERVKEGRERRKGERKGERRREGGRM